MGCIIVLSSGLHGSGKSKISRELKKILEKKYTVYRLSVGDIFREIAKEMGYLSIEDFIDKITSNVELSLKVDVEVDKRMIKKIEKLSILYDFLIIDSNLAPYYLDNSSLRLVVFTKPEIAAERVFKNSRIMDKKYSSIEEVKNSLIERSRDDIRRYRLLSERVKEEFLQNLYKTGSKIMEKLLNYSIHNNIDGIKKDGEIMQHFDGVINNNGDIRDTLEQVLKYIREKFGVKL